MFEGVSLCLYHLVLFGLKFLHLLLQISNLSCELLNLLIFKLDLMINLLGKAWELDLLVSQVFLEHVNLILMISLFIFESLLKFILHLLDSFRSFLFVVLDLLLEAVFFLFIEILEWGECFFTLWLLFLDLFHGLFFFLFKFKL